MVATKARILSVTIHKDVDTDPDLSWLGEYKSQRPARAHIDREERGDMGRGEYQFFEMSSNYDGEKPADQQKYMEQDYKRMEDYNRQGWCMIGVYATAQVVLAGDVVQKIQSGGLWGIESDCDAYHADVEQEQLAELKAQLLAIGLSPRAIAKAFKDVERKEFC